MLIKGLWYYPAAIWGTVVTLWRFLIYNSKLRVGVNSGKLFIKVISFEILSKESSVGNTE